MVEETQVIQLDLVQVTLLWHNKVKQILAVEVDLQCIHHVILQDHIQVTHKLTGSNKEEQVVQELLL